MPDGQPWIAVQPGDLDAWLGAHGPHQVLVDPTAEGLAAAGGPPTWATTPQEGR
jgi:hypothetical protein